MRDSDVTHYATAARNAYLASCSVHLNVHHPLMFLHRCRVFNFDPERTNITITKAGSNGVSEHDKLLSLCFSRRTPKVDGSIY